MPGADDTLTDGGPALDPLDELCTCGHTRGEHHTLDEDCTVIDPECPCSAFQLATPEFGNSSPILDDFSARLDQLLDANDEADRKPRNNTREAIDTLRGEAGVLPRRPDIREQAAALREEDERKRREELVDRLANPNDALVTHDERAKELDHDHAPTLDALTDEQREASDIVQGQILDRLCECGHRYGEHWAVDDQCSSRNCACVNWTDPRRTEAGGAFEASRPLDLDAVRRAMRPKLAHPFRTTCCAGCGHEKDDHDLAERHACVLDGCGCQAFVEYTSPGLDPKNLTFAHDENIGPHPDDIEAGIFAGLKRYRDTPDTRRPYVPPLLRKRYMGDAELRALIGDLPVLEELPEVDRVTINHDAEHWHEIERLALFPQGSSEITASDRTTIAIANCLLGLRRSLGVSHSHNEQLVAVLQKNAEAIAKTTDVLDIILQRFGLIPDDTAKAATPADEGEDT